MKKCGTYLVMIALTGMLCCACQKVDQKQPMPETESTAEESTAEESTEIVSNAAESSTAETEPETKPEKTEKPGFLSVSTYNDYDSQYSDDNMEALYTASIKYIHLDEKAGADGELTAADFPKLSKTLGNYNEEQKKNMNDWTENARADIPEILENRTEDPFPTYQYNSNIFVQRADTYVFSFLNETYIYQAGVHGMTYFQGYSYDTRTGKHLEISDVIADTSELGKIIADKVMEKFSDVIFEDPDLPGTVDSMIREDTLSWILGYEGITFYFNMYDIAPYASGCQIVNIGFDERPDLFKKDYMTVPDTYAIQLVPDSTYYTDLDGDGKEDVITAEYEMDEYGTYTSYKVTVNDKQASVETFDYSMQPTLIHTGEEKNYIYIDSSSDNDWELLYVFDITSEPVYLDYLGGTGITGYSYDMNSYMTYVLTDPNAFSLEVRSDLISTTTLTREYGIGNNGMPEAKSDYFFYAFSPDLTAKIDMTFKTRAGEEKLLLAGTKLICISTDNETYVDMKAADGTVYIVPVDPPLADDWENSVDGKRLEDVFDGVMFAG